MLTGDMPNRKDDDFLSILMENGIDGTCYFNTTYLLDTSLPFLTFNDFDTMGLIKTDRRYLLPRLSLV